MDIITALKADHKEVAALIKKLLKSTTPKAKESLFSQIYEALTIHSGFEEKHFYPSVKVKGKTNNLVLEAYVEHGLIKSLLSDLKGLSPKDETWKAKVTVLQETVKHHVKEEEQDLFPKAKKILDKEELVAMGKEYLRFKNKNKS